MKEMKMSGRRESNHQGELAERFRGKKKDLGEEVEQREFKSRQARSLSIPWGSPRPQTLIGRSPAGRTLWLPPAGMLLRSPLLRKFSAQGSAAREWNSHFILTSIQRCLMDTGQGFQCVVPAGGIFQFSVFILF